MYPYTCVYVCVFLALSFVVAKGKNKTSSDTRFSLYSACQILRQSRAIPKLDPKDILQKVDFIKQCLQKLTTFKKNCNFFIATLTQRHNIKSQLSDSNSAMDWGSIGF